MDKRKILLYVAILLIFVGVFLCFFAVGTKFFDCDCSKNDKEQDTVIKEEKIYNGTVVDMELHLVYSVSFDHDVVDSLDLSSANLELAIMGKYLLVVDGDAIWFDDFNGYAMYRNDIVSFDDKTIKELSEIFGSNKDGECCSCCDDLQPGESCIALCCPCSE